VQTTAGGEFITLGREEAKRRLRKRIRAAALATDQHGFSRITKVIDVEKDNTRASEWRILNETEMLQQLTESNVDRQFRTI
jgi:hypothetical protein